MQRPRAQRKTTKTTVQKEPAWLEPLRGLDKFQYVVACDAVTWLSTCFVGFNANDRACERVYVPWRDMCTAGGELELAARRSCKAAEELREKLLRISEGA